MSKKVVGLLIGLGIILLLVVPGCNSYNTMVTKDEAVNTSWSQVENQYQRRADLIPNLVETVKGYAKQEKDVLTEVVEARAKATQVTVDPSNMTAEQMAEYQQAQGELSSALGKLMVVVERYPELKSNENFMTLQKQLEGTENRIAVERNRYNETVKEYNVYVRSFPQKMYAGIFGFPERTQFESDEGAEKAPDVNFTE